MKVETKETLQGIALALFVAGVIAPLFCIILGWLFY